MLHSDQTLSLVILAAGMGRRFGGLKQIAPVGPLGETILDYSLRDANAAGFRRVVFIIREEIEEAFRETILPRVPAGMMPVLVHQRTDDLPGAFPVPEGRTKPWGTGQALWAAREVVPGPFMVINADDYYGPGAFRVLAAFLREPPAGTSHALAGYALAQTLSAHGAVSRGICTVAEGGDRLQKIAEHHGIARSPEGRLTGFYEGQPVSLAGDAVVSLNAWGFSADFWIHLESGLRAFLDHLQNPLEDEYYLPAAVMQAMAAGQRVAVCRVDDEWLGVTYAEDLPAVRERLARLRHGG